MEFMKIMLNINRLQVAVPGVVSFKWQFLVNKWDICPYHSICNKICPFVEDLF